MKRIIGIITLGLIAFSACDDGRIYEHTKIQVEKGQVLKLTGSITGISGWGEDYSVVIAGFNEESDYAIVTKGIPERMEQSKGEVLMTGISSEVTRLDLCVINKLRKRIVSFATIDCTENRRDTLRMNVERLNIGMYQTIQTKLFETTCANCHGASNQAAAGLYLTTGKSYNALVGKPSRIETEMLLVKPKESEASLLYQLLTSNISASWRYDHSKEVLSYDMQDLVEYWIEQGANKN